jgi:hypothetical protein
MKDPWLGGGNSYALSAPLIQFLREHSIISLNNAKVGTPQPRGRNGWISAVSLDLLQYLAEEWNSYISKLCENYISIEEETKYSLV